MILHKCTETHDHMLHCFWGTTHNRCNFYFSFWAIFCPKIFKNWKKLLEISPFYTCVPKIMITWCIVPEIWYVTEWTDGWTDGQMDGWKKWHIEVGVPLKKTEVNQCQVWGQKTHPRQSNHQNIIFCHSFKFTLIAAEIHSQNHMKSILRFTKLPDHISGQFTICSKV